LSDVSPNGAADGTSPPQAHTQGPAQENVVKSGEGFPPVRSTTLGPPPLHPGADHRTMGLMSLKAKKKTTPTGLAAKHKASVLGRSALTGTRVLRPASKGGTVSLRQVRSALRRLDVSAPK
jgi:hypothetical protein